MNSGRIRRAAVRRGPAVMVGWRSRAVGFASSDNDHVDLTASALAAMERAEETQPTLFALLPSRARFGS
jgi:hypothetical protein